MKKVLLVALAISMVLAGCKKKGEEQEFVFEYVDDGSSQAEEVVSKGNKAAAGTVEAYVTPQYENSGTLEFSFEETDSYTIDFSYRIPKITDVSDDAKSINNEIFGNLQDMVVRVEAMVKGTASEEETYEPNYTVIDYDAYLNGDIVSIVVRYESPYSDWVEYKVFNYNVSTQTAVSNDELLETVGMSKDDFLNKAKKSFGAIALPDLDDYLKQSEDNTEEQANDAASEEASQADTQVESEDSMSVENDNAKYVILADYIGDYVATVSDKNINTDMQVFLDANGEINAVGLVYVPAGSGQYYHLAKLEDKDNSAMIKKYCEYANTYHFDGFEKALLNLYGDEGYKGSIVRKITLSNMSSEEVYIGFDSNDASIFTMQFYGADYSNVYTGTLRFDTIDDNGIVYSFELNTKNGEVLESEEELPHTGRFYLSPYTEYSTEESITGATYKYLDGEDMLASDGYPVDFRLTFG